MPFSILESMPAESAAWRASSATVMSSLRRKVRTSRPMAISRLALRFPARPWGSCISLSRDARVMGSIAFQYLKRGEADGPAAEFHHGVEQAIPEIVARRAVGEQIKTRGFGKVAAQDDAAHPGDRGLGDRPFGKAVGPTIDTADLGEHLGGVGARKSEPEMGVRPRHRIADGPARLLLAPTPRAVEPSDETAFGGEGIHQQHLVRRQPEGNLAAGLAIAAIAVGTHGHALAGQPFDAAPALEPGARERRQVGKAHLSGRLLVGHFIAEIDRDQPAIGEAETCTSVHELSMHETEPRLAFQPGAPFIRHGSHLLALVFGVIEWQRYDFSLDDRAAGDPNIEAASELRLIGRDIGEADGLAQRGRAYGRSDAPDDIVAPNGQMTLLRHRCFRIGKGEAHKLAGQWASRLDRDRSPAHEVRLVLGDRPGHARLMRMGQPVGVLADDDMPLFEAQHPLGL